MTAVLVSCGLYEHPVRIVLVPSLREVMSFKNTVASSPAELKEFLQALKTKYEPKFGVFPEVDFSLLDDPIWYLEVLKMCDQR